MKQLFNKLFSVIKNILIESRKSVKNFIIFALTLALLNFCIRYILITTFSANDKYTSNVILFVSTIISISVILSIIIFYIRFYYTKGIKIFFSNFIDLERLDTNRERWDNLGQEAQKQFPDLNFKARFLILPLIFVFMVSIKFYSAHKDSQFIGLVFLFLAILFFLYFLYLRILRQAILMTKIPLELEPLAPKYLKVWWEFTFFIGDWLGDIFFGSGRSKSVLTEEQRLTRVRRRYYSFGLLAAVLYSAVSTEIWLYNATPYTPFSSRLLNYYMVGYYSHNTAITHAAWELDRRGCNMGTFCYPGTRRLDDTAVQDAYDYVEEMRNNGQKIGHNISRPVGPYAEHKEFDNSISYEKPLSNNDAISDKKENGDLK